MSAQIGAHYTGGAAIRDPSYFKTPYRLVILIALAVFVGEAFVMMILSFFPPSTSLLHALCDATMLILLVSPILYFFVLRPLLRHFNNFKHAQMALRDSERQLIQAEKMSSLGLLVSATAHELQNPNGVFTLNLPILKDYLEELLPILDRQCKEQDDCILYRMSYREIREDIIRIIANLEQSSREISTFISNLKGFSRPSEEMKLESADLKSIVAQVVSICRNQIAKTIKSFTVDIPEDYPLVMTDTQALKQILLNLLLNAAQAADKENSSLKVKAISGDTWREHTIIEISDNGCGMDEATRQKIFDPFFTTKSATKGTGLGLYICYNLLESMGGHIEVESEPGKGSTFRITVPDTMAQRTVQN